MYTIKQAADLTGVPEASLRAWERRYGVAAPLRTEAGYRLYDDNALRVITAIRRLVDQGWPASRAAATVLAESAPDEQSVVPERDAAVAHLDRAAGLPDDAAALTAAFLGSARSMDDVLTGRVLDRAFSRGSFETVVDDWLMPSLRALGEAWARGEVDVAAEHLASHAVLRRLSAAFEAAGRPDRGPLVAVGLPAGCRHELAALAFATGLRRFGVRVHYMGADVPIGSWVHAVTANAATAAVIGVPTSADKATALATVEALTAAAPGMLVAVGGEGVDEAMTGIALELPQRISDAVRWLDRRLAYV